MAKGKGSSSGGGKSKNSSSNAATPKCTCDHPYQCSCGNRPPRPSKGHKWDSETQQWGGKGHKQKGASGQSGVVGQQAKTTEIGQTQVAQWQRLPSQLLAEYCQSKKRPMPKYKELQQGNKTTDTNTSSSSSSSSLSNNNNNKATFKIRCIVPDAKDREKDLILIPAQPVSNAEQAKEEAALLALWQLTPNLPHERKLPEPYKTTWLTILQQQQQQKQKTAKGTGPSLNNNNNNNNNTTSSTQKATANTNLTLATSHVSAADRRQHQEKMKQERNARIRRHEAIRMANRDHPVFLSAKLRLQIQQVLQQDQDGDGDLNIQNTNNNNNNNLDDDDDDDDNAPELDSFQSELQQYVEERLHQEGFTKRQARKSFEQQIFKDKVGTEREAEEEEEWENVYEECLQWLCVHLPETLLPEGFDPRGQTLEVVAFHQGNSTKPTNSVSTDSSSALSTEAKQLADRFGLTSIDANWLLSLSSSQKGTSEENVEALFWNRIVQLVPTDASTRNESTTAISNNHQEDNAQLQQDEMEALEAMFPDGLKVSKSSSGGCHITTICIATPGNDDLSLTITYDTSQYPSTARPQTVVCSAQKKEYWLHPGLGVGFHIELAKFLSTLSLGEPMIFEIYNQFQTLQQTMEEIPHDVLLSDNTTKSTPSSSQVSKPAKQETATLQNKGIQPKKSIPVTFKARRPRERGIFWSTHPSRTPPATAFPKLPKSLELQRKELPAGKARAEFLSALAAADEKGSRVVLVTGDTGCGKTTQIPQFILEEAPENAKIVVAQPRRLAATGVAARVAEERGEDRPGMGSVGYVVRGDSAVSKATRLLFCTFGVLLRQMQCEGALDNITHVVIDEVHERNLDGDVLMALLKECLKTVPNLRVVLMSATLDADRFAAYWGNNTPRMHIPGRTFPVDDYFLEDVLTVTGYNPPKKRKNFFRSNNQQKSQQQRKSTPWDDSELSDRDEDGEEVEETPEKEEGPQFSLSEGLLEERVKRVDESHIDYDMLGQLVKYLVAQKAMGKDGSILVFLPGAPEINMAKTIIGKITDGLPITLLPLHGGLQPKEQNIVFRPAQNSTKVILSTNVAETSITIPDCTVVIDGCREKQSSYDPVNRMPLLLEVFASKASLKQRRGRAGRVRAGKCYKLISRASYAKLHDHTPAEITRCALDQTLLNLLFLGVEHGNGNFLQTLLDPPKQESVDAASFSLLKLGALERVDMNELRLTPLGMHLAGIPAPPVVGKMLVMGSVLGCRRAALAMAAGISTGRSPFLRVDVPYRKTGKEETVEETKKRHILEERAKLFEQCGNSDHAMLAAAFLNWENLGTGGGERKRYCDKLGLNFSGMRDILQLVNQYDSALASAGFDQSPDANRNAKSWRVLRTCAVASMAPSQLVRVHRPSTKYASTAEGAREKEGVAKELKFFIRSEEESDRQGKEDRVFIHPSSALFSVGNFGCPWLVYNSMVKTTKPFLRDATECSAYALLLFGGKLEVEARNSVITVDGWVKLAANARIGALIRGLRGKLDSLLSEKIQNPMLDIVDTPVMNLIVKLLSTDGLGH